MGLLLISIIMNYSQHRNYVKLKEEASKARGSIIILPNNKDMNPNYWKPKPDRDI